MEKKTYGCDLKRKAFLQKECATLQQVLQTIESREIVVPGDKVRNGQERARVRKMLTAFESELRTAPPDPFTTETALEHMQQFIQKKLERKAVPENLKLDWSALEEAVENAEWQRILTAFSQDLEVPEGADPGEYWPSRLQTLIEELIRNLTSPTYCAGRPMMVAFESSQTRARQDILHWLQLEMNYELDYTLSRWMVGAGEYELSI